MFKYKQNYVSKIQECISLVCEKKELRSLEAVVGDFIDTKFIRIKLKTYYVNIAVLEELDLMVVVSVMGLLTLILKVLNHQREYERYLVDIQLLIKYENECG